MNVGDSLLTAMASGDKGGQVRMLEMLGNGFNEAKRYGEALAFFERAIKVRSSTPDAGFPYMAYEGESAALANQGNMSEAKDKLERALVVAKENQKLRVRVRQLCLRNYNPPKRRITRHVSSLP